MITVKVNIVALILAGLATFVLYSTAKSYLTNLEILGMIVGTVIVVRIYDAVAGMEAFKEKKKEKNAKSS